MSLFSSSQGLLLLRQIVQGLCQAVCVYCFVLIIFIYMHCPNAVPSHRPSP